MADKIISLQGIGLGMTVDTRQGFVYFPYTMNVGQPLVNEVGLTQGVLVTTIELDTDYYVVKTSDNHTRILPANKFIAEWGGRR